ncbi:chorismate lyase [uncultured Pseudomonas sp.]|uniref:chorismate--pyruvate lyase family protein n=1 Tax=uncultured Pseudomonas sp. TaxID=114707 RepID=UPI0025CBFA05|nr:chorismate lyase [uncultured Pseudomonas sp.]
MTQHTPSAADASWLAREQLDTLPTAQVLDWLFNHDSLTRRLTRLSHDRFSVVPSAEGWQPLRDDECSALDLPPGSEGWVREVYLLGQDEPWVFARSVAGREALRDSGLHMDALGTRSLGELLFSNPAFDRGALRVRRYPTQWLPVQARTEGLWARRSRFSRGTLGILVAEVFLPAFWVALNAADLNNEEPS